MDAAHETGSTFTSGRRTTEGNRAVGGVPNSRHLRGDAADFAPGKGQAVSALARSLARLYPGAKIITEGDHVHVQQTGWNVPYWGARGTIGR